MFREPFSLFYRGVLAVYRGVLRVSRKHAKLRYISAEYIGTCFPLGFSRSGLMLGWGSNPRGFAGKIHVPAWHGARVASVLGPGRHTARAAAT